MCGIYKYENPINHMVYIGQAIDLQERHKKHYQNISDKKHQEDIYKAFREFGFNNFIYEILEQFENFDQDKLNELECYYIEKFNSLAPNGYNMVPGGTNGAGLAKGKPVEYYDIYGNYIETFNSAHQAARKTGIDCTSICECCRQEKRHTKGYQWKYVDSNKIIKDISKDGIVIMKRKVFQYDLKGNLIKVYDSLKEAAKTTGIAKATICKVCCLKGNTAGGYVWRYENDDFNAHKTLPKERVIEQYDKNMNLLNTFNSLTEAAQKTNSNLGNIQAVCAGKRKTTNGYIWKYKNKK